MDNLLILAMVIIVFWLGVMAFYFYTSRQSRDLEQDINDLRAMLDEGEEERV
jgi:preprotein translocase subunit YajC